MTEKYDPRAPRRNSEFWDTWQTILAKWKEIKSADEYNVVRGQALILQAHIEYLLEQPEFVYDMAPGPIVGQRPFILPDGDREAAESGEDPFKHPGPDQGKYFYYTYSKQMTALFEQGRDNYNPFNLSGYWVIRFEKIYTAEQETTMHVTSEEAFNRMISPSKSPGRDDRGKYAIFMDPRGFYSGQAAMPAGIVESHAQAVDKVNHLSGWLNIRFLAAKMVGWVDTH